MHIPILITLSGIVGLMVGSFLNVVIDRGWRGETLGGRSHCDTCKKTLTISELVPVASFLWQKGICRSCRASLSGQYPLVEGATGVSYAFAAYYLSSVLPIESIFFASLAGIFIVLAAMIVIFVSDVKYYIIPDKALVVIFLSGVAAVIWRANYAPFNAPLWDIGSAAFFSFILAALWFFSRGQWLGLGDAKLIGALALLLGFPASVSLFLFSFWLGALWAVFLLILRRKKLRDRMPFGPFILAAALLAYFWGESFLAAMGLLALL